jgi:hypothetical protein
MVLKTHKIPWGTLYRVDHKVGQCFFLKVSKIKKKIFSSTKYLHNFKNWLFKKSKTDQLYGPPYIAAHLYRVHNQCPLYAYMRIKSKISF